MPGQSGRARKLVTHATEISIQLLYREYNQFRVDRDNQQTRRSPKKTRQTPSTSFSHRNLSSAVSLSSKKEEKEEEEENPFSVSVTIKREGEK